MRNRLLLMARKRLVPGYSALWLFNEGTGQVLYDWSGNGYHGTLGSTTGEDTNDPAWSAEGLTFTADDNVVCSTAITAAAIPYTLEIVAYLPAPSATLFVASKATGQASDKEGWNLDYRADGKVYFGQNDSNAGKTLRVPVGVTYTQAAWQHIAAGWDGANVFLKIGTAATVTAACTGYTPAAAQNFTLGGKSYYPNAYFEGKIAAALAYPTALTAAQITQNYTALKGTLAARGVTVI